MKLCLSAVKSTGSALKRVGKMFPSNTSRETSTFVLSLRHTALKQEALTLFGGVVVETVAGARENSESAVSEVPRAVASFLDLKEPKRYQGHSLRATGATAMADGGATEVELRLAGNWQSSSIAQSYVRSSLPALLARADMLVDGRCANAQTTAPAVADTVTLQQPVFMPGNITFLGPVTGCTFNVVVHSPPNPSKGE